MDGVVFAKTSAGQDEVLLRRVQMHPRVRALLILVDGKQSVGELVGKFAAEPDLVHEHFLLLQGEGLIEAIFVPEPVQEHPKTGPMSEQPMAVHPTPFSEPHTTAPQEAVLQDETSRLMALYRIYTETINQCFSSRAGAYHKQLSQAARVGDYIALGNQIITALNKSGRIKLAVAFKARVRPLLK